MNATALKRGFRYQITSPSGKIKIDVYYVGRKARGTHTSDVFAVVVSGTSGSMERTGIASTRAYVKQLVERFKDW